MITSERWEQEAFSYPKLAEASLVSLKKRETVLQGTVHTWEKQKRRIARWVEGFKYEVNQAAKEVTHAQSLQWLVGSAVLVVLARHVTPIPTLTAR